MSLYKCNGCNQFYTHPKEVDEIIDKCSIEMPVIAVVLECPECGSKHVLGGEFSYDPHSNECIMMFGCKYNPKTDKDLQFFKSQILEECRENESIMSTWDGRTINLKIRKE